jgi:SAM-dependent methyltransferase
VRKSVSKPGVREGYDRWAGFYDATPNPVVALDRRYTLDHLNPRDGEWILDAGCGTGENLRGLIRAGSRPIGIDFSRGMLRVARRKLPRVPLARADLNHPLPLIAGIFDGFLCALVSEHLKSLRTLFTEAFAALRDGGRLAFSAFHPELVAAGIEANFEEAGTEYRLGAEPYTVEDYLDHIFDAGFRDLQWVEHHGDEDLVEEVPEAHRYVGRPLLIVVHAVRPHGRWSAMAGPS